MTRTVAVLLARADSIYKSMPGTDVYDIDRDAVTWPGGAPVVAHPPCRSWGQLRSFAKPRPGERDLAPWAIEQVRRWGGVLEHPYGSQLWAACGIPRRGADAHGGHLMSAPQMWWGHRAEKPTCFYICGLSPRELPVIPFVMGEAARTVCSGRGLRKGMPGYRTPLTKPERERTPPILAAWLLDVARWSRARQWEAA